MNLYMFAMRVLVRARERFTNSSLRRRRCRWHRGVLAGLLLLCSASTVSALEPQTIVGDWIGKWHDSLGASDAVYVTVTKVSGDRVEGTLYWRATPGAPSDNRDLPFVGTLVGSTLSATLSGSPLMSFSYNIDRAGTRMSGFFQATIRSGVSLGKKE
jgi:hypothetical protein